MIWPRWRGGVATLASSSVLVVGHLVSVAPIQAGTAEKTSTADRASALTAEERIDLRRELMRGALASSKKAAVEEVTYLVDGATDPRALMPTELFDALISNADNSDGKARDLFRQVFQDASATGLDWIDLWSLVEEAGREMRSLDDQRHDLAASLTVDPTARGTSDSHRELERLSRKQCLRRLEMLLEAERKFGKEKFEEFLYTAVAPLVSISSSVPEDLEQEARRLREIEGGCQ